MSILATAGSVLLLVICSLFVADLSRAETARARAQAAADAAALAAVAESTPYGSGSPLSAAYRYAHANGAKIVDCICDTGALAVQLVAETDGVRATARAVLDPSRLAPTMVPASAEGLDPRLSAAVATLVDASGGRVWIVSGFRSPARQAQLWSQALARYGDPESADDWVARPGTSMHERGLAVDLGGDAELAAALVDRLDLPLERPLSWEPWHFELSES